MACFASGQRQAASTILGWPASLFLPEPKPLSRCSDRSVSDSKAFVQNECRITAIDEWPIAFVELDGEA